MRDVVSRRDLLRLAGCGAGAITLPMIGGCGDTESPSPAGADSPRRGGTLTGAFSGGGPAESLDPYSAASPADFARNRSVYDVLFWTNAGTVVPSLATAAAAAPDGKSFRLTLRKDVRFHDGSPFTADDVAFTFRYLTDPARRYPSELSGYIDVAGIRSVDSHTLDLPLRRPIGDPPGFLAANPVFVLKNGTTAFTAGQVVGTGPLRVTDFTPGRSSTLERFDDHWDGAPHIDKLVVLSVNDAQARVSAVRAGQADFAASLPYVEAKKMEGDGQLVVLRSAAGERTGYGFMLNMTRSPFADPRVRRAVRLAIDRQKLVDTVFLGYGVVGNDLFGAGSQHYADLPPLARDLEQARRLIEEAGARGAAVTVRAAEVESGYTASTTLFAEQMKDIGLAVTPQIVTPAEFFDVQALGTANAVTFAIYSYPLQSIHTRTALFPSLAFNDPEYTAALAAAISDPDEPQRVGAWREAQRLMHDRGNWVVWGYGDSLNLARGRVHGVEGRGLAKYPYLAKAWVA